MKQQFCHQLKTEIMSGSFDSLSGLNINRWRFLSSNSYEFPRDSARGE